MTVLRKCGDDFFPLSRIVTAVFALSGGCRVAESVHLIENLANHIRGIDLEVKEGSVEDDGLEPSSG
jgi:hypothetical protein